LLYPFAKFKINFYISRRGKLCNVSKILLQKTLLKVQFKNELDKKKSFSEGSLSPTFQIFFDKSLRDFLPSITLIQSLRFFSHLFKMVLM